MKNRLLSIIMSLCIAVTFTPLIAESVSAVSVATPTFISLSPEGYTDGTLIIKMDNSVNSAIQIDTSIQIQNVTTGEIVEVGGNATRFAFQNLTLGRTYQVKIRTHYYDRKNDKHYYSSWSSTKSAVVPDGSSYPEQIKLNTWYAGTTTEQPEYFKIKTTGRSDSKYKFFVRTTYAKLGWFQTTIEMAKTGRTLGYGAYETPDSDVYAPSQSLKANHTYRIKLFGEGSALGYEPDVDYEFIVKEIIAKPATGKVTSWKGGKKKATLKFAKLAKATKYQVACKKKGGSYKYRYTTKRTVVIKNLAKNKYYYVKVRGIRIINGKKYPGKWSAVKKTKVK